MKLFCPLPWYTIFSSQDWLISSSKHVVTIETKFSKCFLWLSWAAAEAGCGAINPRSPSPLGPIWRCGRFGGVLYQFKPAGPPAVVAKYATSDSTSVCGVSRSYFVELLFLWIDFFLEHFAIIFIFSAIFCVCSQIASNSSGTVRPGHFDGGSEGHVNEVGTFLNNTWNFY